MLAPWFAMAGLACAAGPIVIHLLNRRRFRVVAWGAMDFLKEALQRSRRWLEWRDLLLMVLRTACVLLFGLALARPYFAASSTGEVQSNQPAHAVLVVDNSLSMGVQALARVRLDLAKEKAASLIRELPAASRISILPLCGGGQVSADPYRTPEDALEALQTIPLVDRAGNGSAAAEMAAEACKLAPDLPSKQIFFLGDQQARNWPTGALAHMPADGPPMQIVAIGLDQPANAWIEDFRIQDGVADVETPTRFLATLRYEGSTPRSNVQVKLTIDGAEAASQTIALEPGQTRQIEFVQRLDVPAEPGKPSFVAAKLSLTPDELPQDDERFLVAPVVAALPVVFVDQYGEDENPAANRYGETFPLRRLLAPVTAKGAVVRELVQVRRTRIELLDRRMLADARMVIVAGVERPSPGSVQLLREYALQGGQVVVAAGAGFDPAAWTQDAWLDGKGVLPLPLAREPIGRVPTSADQRVEPFPLDFDSMKSFDAFLLPNTPEEELAALYGAAYFFKAVRTDDSDKTIAELLDRETKRFADERAFLAQALPRSTAGATAAGSAAKSSPTAAAGAGTAPGAAPLSPQEEARLRELAPEWLAWREAVSLREDDLAVERLAESRQPRVLARFINKAPFLVERPVGRGKVLWVASGLTTQWNNLARTHAMLIFDRLLRDMLQGTIPTRNYGTSDEILLPVGSEERRLRYTLVRPGRPQESLSVEALGANTFGVSVRDASQRGLYLVTAFQGESDPEKPEEGKLWQAALAVNGPADESQLQPTNEPLLKERLGTAPYRWVGAGETVRFEAAAGSYGWWKWLMLGVLVMLLAELGVLAATSLAAPRKKASPGAFPFAGSPASGGAS